MDSLKKFLADIDSSKFATRLVGFFFISLYVQSLLMGLNRENGNDFTQFMKFAGGFFSGTAQNGWSSSFYSSLFPVFIFGQFNALPVWLAHAIWYFLLLSLFIVSMRRVFSVNRKFDSVLFALIFLPFIEVLQSNMLNGQMNILPLASLLGFYASVKSKNDTLGSLFLGLTVSLRFEAIVFLLFPLVERNWKQLVQAIVIIFLLSVFLPLLVAGNAVPDFYSFFYLNLSKNYASLGANYWGLLNLPLHMLLVILVVSLHIYISKKRKQNADVLFLYIPLMLLLFSPLFATHHLVWLFPVMFAVARYIKECAVWQNSSLYLYLIVLFSYLVSRAMDEPKTGYLITVGFSFIALLSMLLRKEKKA